MAFRRVCQGEIAKIGGGNHPDTSRPDRKTKKYYYAVLSRISSAI
jgi:hypothetical protein